MIAGRKEHHVRARDLERRAVPHPRSGWARRPRSLDVLEHYVDPRATLGHADGGAIKDVSAHSMAVDPSTGASVWHTEWELGHCDYTDESGYPRAAYAWHRHPLGTEYTEIYQR